jgi:hypothetical protein
MPDAMSFVDEAVEPDSIDCEKYSRHYEWNEDANDYVLSFVVLHVKYYKAGSLATHRDITVNRHGVNRAIIRLYNEAREPVYKAARDAAYQPAYDAAIAAECSPEEAARIATHQAQDAGEQAVSDAGIMMADSTATWSNIESAVGNTIAPIDALRILSSKPWGELMIRKAWAKEQVA